MPVLSRINGALLIGLTAVLVAVPALAADPPRHDCLTKAEQRAAVGSHRAISLAKALRSARKHGRQGELVRARLCHRGAGLAYELTLLTRSGKVTHAAVDAANGELIKGR